MVRKFKKVAKTKKGVPKKYLKGAKNKSKREREILNTMKLYKMGQAVYRKVRLEKFTKEV
jgi:hypothetical protein